MGLKKSSRIHHCQYIVTQDHEISLTHIRAVIGHKSKIFNDVWYDIEVSNMIKIIFCCLRPRQQTNKANNFQIVIFGKGILDVLLLLTNILTDVAQ